MTGPATATATATATDWLLQAEGIHKRFGDHGVLRGVSVQASQGDRSR